MSIDPTESRATKWPTLGDKVKSWDATCSRCGEKFPPDTLILGVWSPTVIHVSCKCSPREWVTLECKP